MVEQLREGEGAKRAEGSRARFRIRGAVEGGDVAGTHDRLLVGCNDRELGERCR